MNSTVNDTVVSLVNQGLLDGQENTGFTSLYLDMKKIQYVLKVKDIFTDLKDEMISMGVASAKFAYSYESDDQGGMYISVYVDSMDAVSPEGQESEDFDEESFYEATAQNWSLTQDDIVHLVDTLDEFTPDSLDKKMNDFLDSEELELLKTISLVIEKKNLSATVPSGKGTPTQHKL